MMGGWLFWMVVIFVVWRLAASRGRGHRSERRRFRSAPGSFGPTGAATSRELEERSYIDALETRVTELEERLDFTERLLAGRGKMAQRAG